MYYISYRWHNTLDGTYSPSAALLSKILLFIKEETFKYDECVSSRVHICSASSPSTNFNHNFYYLKTTMNCILFDMNIFWDMKAARVCKRKD